MSNPSSSSDSEPLFSEKSPNLKKPAAVALEDRKDRHVQKVTHYDIFTFETVVRDLVDRAIKPLLDTSELDSKRLVSTHLTITDLQKRIVELEQFAKIQPKPTLAVSIQEQTTQQTAPKRATTSLHSIYKEPGPSSKHWTRFDDYDRKLAEVKLSINEAQCDC